MNFYTFQQAFKERDLIQLNEITMRFPNFDSQRLNDWQKKGYIRKIINRYYGWADVIYAQKERFFIAGRIYAPSYISLKSALHWYGFIPEGVYDVFSVSTRKTIEFDTEIGYFSYKMLKTKLYFGYQPIIDKRTSFLIADPEKAILDTFYLYSYLQDETDIDGLRFNYEEMAVICSIEKLQLYAKAMENKRVSSLTKILIAKIY